MNILLSHFESNFLQFKSNIKCTKKLIILLWHSNSNIDVIITLMNNFLQKC